MESDLVDIMVHKHAETAKAVLVSTTGFGDDAVWLPLSQIEIVQNRLNKGLFEITLPEWLAIDKGLV